MRQFTYTMTAPDGLHARPAALLAETARGLACDVIHSKDGRNASARRLMALMLLEVHQGDTVTVTVEGPGEDEAARTIEAFFHTHF